MDVYCATGHERVLTNRHYMVMKRTCPACGHMVADELLAEKRGPDPTGLLYVGVVAVVVDDNVTFEWPRNVTFEWSRPAPKLTVED